MATDLEQLTLRIEANTRGVDRALKTLNKNMDAQFRAMENRASSFEKHVSAIGRSALGVFATFGAGLGVAQLAQGLATTALEMDRVNKALTVATGSGAAARAEFEFIRATANNLGLELMSTAQQYAFLAAAAKGTALEGQTTRDIFVGVATAASSLGLTAADTAGVLNAVQQMISKGVVSAEELRGQMGERLPGAFSAAARAMNMTEQELGKALETGKVMAEDLLPKLAAELMKVSDAAGSGLQAELNRLNNAWVELNLAFADTGSIDVAISAIQALTNALKLMKQAASRGFLDDIAAGVLGGGITGYARALTGIAGSVAEDPKARTASTMSDSPFRSAMSGAVSTGLNFLARQAPPPPPQRTTLPSSIGSGRSGFGGSGSSSRGALREAESLANLVDDALSSAEQRALALADDRTEQKLANAFIVNEQVWEEQEAAALRVRDAYEQLGEMAAGALDDIIIKGEDAGQVIGRLLLKIAEMIALQSISGQGAFATLFGFKGVPGRAGGGPVNRGQPYLVGEQGPELMIPQSAGRIVPRGQMGGGGTSINFTSVINAPGANPATLALMDQMLSARDAKLRREMPSLIADRQRRNQMGGAFR